MKDRSILYAIILGMAMQATIAGMLSAIGVIDLRAGQQLICALLYVIVAVILMGFETKEK